MNASSSGGIARVDAAPHREREGHRGPALVCSGRAHVRGSHRRLVAEVLVASSALVAEMHFASSVVAEMLVALQALVASALSSRSQHHSQLERSSHRRSLSRCSSHHRHLSPRCSSHRRSLPRCSSRSRLSSPQRTRRARSIIRSWSARRIVGSSPRCLSHSQHRRWSAPRNARWFGTSRDYKTSHAMWRELEADAGSVAADEEPAVSGPYPHKGVAASDARSSTRHDSRASVTARKNLELTQ